jgi:hypothetical protein
MDIIITVIDEYMCLKSYTCIIIMFLCRILHKLEKTESASKNEHMSETPTQWRTLKHRIKTNETTGVNPCARDV